MRGCRAVQLVMTFDCRSEGILQNFSEDVFEMDRNVTLITSQATDAADGTGSGLTQMLRLDVRRLRWLEQPQALPRKVHARMHHTC